MFLPVLPANVDNKRDLSNLKIIFDLLHFRSTEYTALNEPVVCRWIIRRALSAELEHLALHTFKNKLNWLRKKASPNSVV